MSNDIKDVTYEIEDRYLSPYAFKSRDMREGLFLSKSAKSARSFSATATELFTAKRSGG